MIVLFVLRHPGYIRNYESTIKMLGEKGHTVHVAFNRFYDNFEKCTNALDNIPNVYVHDSMAPVRRDIWWVFARINRYLIDYLRFFDKRLRGYSKLKQRASHRIPKIIDTILLFILSSEMSRRLIRFLKKFENIYPTCRAIDTFIKSFDPDILLITPYVDLKGEQVDYVTCAKRMGLPNVYCVTSWDNLSSKGLIKVEPQSLILWNDFQKDEAIHLHNVPESKIYVTGAQCYDKWFDWKPELTRTKFFETVGFETDNYILYLCSSRFISQNELTFIKQWIEQIRTSNFDHIRNLGILIRPHPQNYSQFAGVDLSAYKNVAIYPAMGDNPVCQRSKQTFFDSIYYSSAVVGLNTSAMIESGILGKPVLTMESNGNDDSQKETMHYHYLKEGGLLFTDTTFNDHIERLNRILKDSELYCKNLKIFNEKFVRPHGLKTACTPLVVDAIEQAVCKKQIPESYNIRSKVAMVFIFSIALLVYAVYYCIRLVKKLFSK